jgi:hypothetical protein
MIPDTPDGIISCFDALRMKGNLHEYDQPCCDKDAFHDAMTSMDFEIVAHFSIPTNNYPSSDSYGNRSKCLRLQQ